MRRGNTTVYYTFANDREVSAEELRAILNYNCNTGEFRWKTKISTKTVVGEVAGAERADSGYVFIGIGGRRYRAHHLAVLYMTGKFPAGELDHIDTNPSNNAWTNLRPATRSQNVANSPLRKTNTSGYKGVCLHKQTGKWNARITKDYKNRSLGLYSTPEEAHRIYCEAARVLFGEYARPC